jgi:hypothetical protein
MCAGTANPSMSLLDNSEVIQWAIKNYNISVSYVLLNKIAVMI